MKRIALYLGIVAALTASCSIQEESFEAPQQDDIVFYASFEKPGEETRVYANEDLYLRWTADDRVSIFNKNTYNQQYKFLGKTGDDSGGFGKANSSEEFVTGRPVAHIVSVYPYQEGTRITEDETLTLTLPAEQHYAENTFGLGANTMVSVSTDNFLQYKNAGGYLVIKLYGERVFISSITLKGNNGEKLAGNATITMPLDGVPSVAMASDATDEITLVCDSPVLLGSKPEESTAFWFVVPPVTFSKGFTVSINQWGFVSEKSTQNRITIERSKLYKMARMEVERVYSVPETVNLGLPSGLKWASFNLGASKPEEYGDYYAWGETEPYYSSLDPLTWKEGKESGYEMRYYKWCMGAYNTMTKYCSDLSYGYNGFTDHKTVLDAEDDAAHVNLGGKWRMPTHAEWQELRDNCTWKWTTRNGVNGRLVTGRNGNSIFFPAAGSRRGTYLDDAGSRGDYWSSSLSTNPNLANNVGFGSGDVTWFGSGRCMGMSVRPVYGDFISVESVSLNKTALSLWKGYTEKLTVTIMPTDATEKTVIWTSSNSSVATVSNGVVTGVSAGTATITVWASDGLFATCTVTVTAYTVATPEAIDLGLPSGLKWASFNLGASEPEEYGDYYAWGETAPKNDYSWSTYKWCMGANNTITKYCSDSSYGYNGFRDGKAVLDPEDDAAHVNLGGKWRMPTHAEWQELRDNCTWKWTTRNGVNGRLVTGSNGNSIFLPAAGYRNLAGLNNAGSVGNYWDTSLNTNYSDNANGIFFNSDNVSWYRYPRFCGRSVRPVTE